MSGPRPRLALTAGDPAGIGPEIVLKALAHREAEAFAAGGRPAAAQPRGFWAALWSGLGGWPAVGGLAAATVAGIWIGYNPNLGVADTLVAALGGTAAADAALADLATGFEFAFEEGEAG